LAKAKKSEKVQFLQLPASSAGMRLRTTPVSQKMTGYFAQNFQQLLNTFSFHNLT